MWGTYYVANFATVPPRRVDGHRELGGRGRGDQDCLTVISGSEVGGGHWGDMEGSLATAYCLVSLRFGIRKVRNQKGSESLGFGIRKVRN